MTDGHFEMNDDYDKTEKSKKKFEEKSSDLQKNPENNAVYLVHGNARNL